MAKSTLTATSQEPSILTGWWDVAVRALAALTTPRADVDECDRAVEQLARDSEIGTVVHRASVITRRAWASSRSRALAVALIAVLQPDQPATAWRVAGWMIAVAGATTLGLNQLAPIAVGPLTWLVPLALVVVGLLVIAAAAPLSRAAADRGRHS